MKIRTVIVAIGFFLLTGLSGIQAQVIIEPNPEIDQMLERYIEVNKAENTVKGYRIQVYATTDRQQFDSFKRSFEFRYPNIPTSWEHSKPYYKLRAGAFASKGDATRMLYVLKKEYPQAYLAIDNNMRAAEIID